MKSNHSKYVPINENSFDHTIIVRLEDDYSAEVTSNVTTVKKESAFKVNVSESIGRLHYNEECKGIEN